MSNLNINPKEFPKGSVVYFVDRNRDGYYVNYGLVEEYYVTSICLQLLQPFDDRLIDGIPIKELVTPTKWNKLPKNWTWNTRLFEVTYSGKKPTGYISNPEDILENVRTGALVKAQDNDDCKIEAEISKTNGWRLIRKYDSFNYNRNYISIEYNKVYDSFDEAKEELDAINAEFQRQAALSDYDWSVEQIDKVLNRWSKMTGEDSSEYRRWLLDRPDVEEICVRIIGKDLEWKYDKNKKWMGIVL